MSSTLLTLQRQGAALIYPLGISAAVASLDYSGNARDGAIVGTTPTFANDGPAGMKGTKAGTYAGGKAQSPASAAWMNATNGAVMCWFRHSNASGIHVLAERRDVNYFILWNRDDAGTPTNHSLQAILYCGVNNIIIDSGLATNDGAWRHAAMTWTWNGSNLTTCTLYLNAVQVAQGTTTTAPAGGSGSSFINERIVFGSEHDLTRNMNGDQLWGAFFNTAVTAADVADIYLAGLREGVTY